MGRAAAAPPASPGELRQQVRLATPLALQQVGLVTMSLVDTAILGRYHADAMAGAGIGNGLTFAVTCLGVGLALGLDPLIAQALGAGERARTAALLRDGLAVVVRWGAALTLVLLATPWLLTLAAVEPAVADEARVYVFARAAGVVPFLAQIALRSFLQAHGHTRPLVVAVIVGNVINAGLDWLLVMGDDGLAAVGLPAVGLPALGALGAALVTSLVTLGTVAYYARAAGAIARGLGPAPAAPRATADVVRLGLPIGLQLFAEVAAFALAAVLAGRMGATPAAAHQVAIQLASVPFSVTLGIGAAAAVRVGLAIGAGDHRAARHAGLVSLGLGAAVMSTSAAIFVVAAAPLAGLFTDEAVVIAAAIPLVQIAAFFQLSDGAQAVAAGALRGAGDTRAAFVANLLGHYLVGLPVALGLGFAAGLGAPGLWWGLVAGLTGTAIALIARFVWLTARPVARAQTTAPPAAGG
ncbi:MAG: MATE family efflux transporter [Kofleriaceae bacterium]|nr:MATE family efflux transporter [Kofleriaceae bacterium]MCL4228481.1 MATE family efflux transporter [Myxococcales bacterium]